MTKKAWHELKRNAGRLAQEVADHIERETQYIEIPMGVRGKEHKIIYPHILVVIIVGAFLGIFFLL